MPPIIDAPNLGLPLSISDVIAKHIRAAIAVGELHEGEPIRQDEVAKSFNVSKVPVREALKRLEAEGFVVFQKNKGAVVTSLSRPEIEQAFQTRAILEAGAIKLSVPHLTPTMLLRSELLCSQFASEPEASKWSDLNWEFHASLYAGVNNAFLLNMVRGINERVERYLRIQLTLANGMAVADREHHELLDVCRSGDADKAAQMMYAHVLDACNSLFDHLPQKK